MTGSNGRGEPWSDERLAAAFRARFATTAPEGLAAETIAAVRAGRAPRTRGPIEPRLSWLGIAAVLAVVAVGTGLALRFGLYPGGGIVTDGPPGLKTFTYGDVAFDFPAEWSIRDASTFFSGGSVIAVVGTLPVSPACGIGHVDINCFYEQRLEPGTISVVVGTGAYRGGTIFDPERAAPPTVRTTIAGMPALFTDRGRPAESYYLSDLDLTWEIAYPATPTNVYRIDVGIRGPGVEDYRRQAEALAASFRFVSPPPALDPAAAAEVARVALDEAESGDRTMWQLGADEVSWYACFDDVTGDVASGEVDSTPGEHLTASLPVECRWSIAAAGTSFWRLELETNWTLGAASGTVRETRWLSANGTATASTFEGDFPPSSIDEPSGEERPLGTAQDAAFYFEVMAGKATYAPDEPIDVSASFTYLGPGTTERVYHAASPIGFRIEEIGGTRVMGGGMDLPCLFTDVASGRPAIIPFAKAGTPTDDGEIGFDRAWYADPALRFPPGRWRIVADLWVYLDDCGGEEHRLEAAVDVIVRADAERPTPTTAGTIQVALGGDVTVSIEDRSGQLVSARAAGPEDFDPLFDPVRPMVGLAPRNPIGQPNELVVEWHSHNCDSTYSLRIDADARALVLGHPVIEACTNLGSGSRGVVLRFSEPVPAVEVQASILENTPVLVQVVMPGPTDVPLLDASGRFVVLGVDDQSGLLVSVRSATVDEFFPGSMQTSTDRAAVANPPGRTHELRVRWSGSACDSRWSLQVGPTARYLEVGHPPREACDSVPVLRDVLLIFSESVPADSVTAAVGATVVIAQGG